MLYSGEPTDQARLAFAIEQAKAFGYLKPGDTVVSTAGQHQQAGRTDLIRFITLEK